MNYTRRRSFFSEIYLIKAGFFRTNHFLSSVMFGQLIRQILEQKKKKNTRQRRITIEKNLHLKTVLMSNAANPTISHHYDHRQCLLDIQNSHACARIPKHADVSYSNKKEFSLACLPLFFSCIHLRIGTSKIRSYRSHTHKHTNTAHTSDSLHDGYSNSYSYTTYYSCKSTSTRKYFE